MVTLLHRLGCSPGAFDRLFWVGSRSVDRVAWKARVRIIFFAKALPSSACGGGGVVLVFDKV